MPLCEDSTVHIAVPLARLPKMMNFKSQTILVSVVLLLLGAAWLVNEDRLWSQIGSFTVPWFCTALALALLILLLVCNLREQAPAELPWLVVVGTVVVVGVVLVAGTEIDNEKYALSGIVGTRWEVAGFMALLLGLFLVAQRYRRS